MKLKEKDGMDISDTWPTPVNIAAPKDDGGCNGIQSPRLSEFGPSNFEYCVQKGWYTTGANYKWHANGCSNDSVDKNGRCSKCCTAYKSINRTHNPKMFQEKETSIVPSEKYIKKTVKDRLKKIEKSDIPTDEVLSTSAKLMQVTNCYKLNIGGSEMFMVCTECSEHRICQKRGGTTV